MKKIAVVISVTLFCLAIFLPFSLNIQAAQAQTNYSIQRVDHNVQILYSGHVVITDKIQLSGQVPSTIQMGFPFRYGSYIVKATAYDANFLDLPIVLGVQLQDQSGFYGATITLPSGTASTFTVAFVLSNTALTATSTGFTLDYPAYPAFAQVVTDCSATLSLPAGTTVVGIDKPDGVVNATTYEKTNLPAFTYSPATATFSAPYGTLQQADIQSLNRQVNVSPSGSIKSTDTYKVINKATTTISSFLFTLPVNASNVVARDQFGRILSTQVAQTNSIVFVQNVTLAVPMNPGDSSILTFDYSLLSISPAQFSRYILHLDLFPYFNYLVDSASVTIDLPEGATLVAPQLSQLGPSDQVTRNAYQETLTINKQDITFVDSIIPSQDVVPITFDYSPLWISFLPTVWMWVLAVVGVVVVALWRRPKAPVEAPRIAVAKVTAGHALTSEDIKNFIDSYEEKTHVTAEIRSLEARADHGRIPRRRYRVQRRTLELRLETLNRHTAQTKEMMRNAGGSLADIVRQLETVEVELNEVELNLKNIEVRHETGEISIDNYRKQLNDLERRKQKAEATIHGLLLRLRGEIHSLT